MRGYLGRPDGTVAVLVDGWLRTRDIGQLDSDGYLRIMGRCKEMIIRGGENIYPKDIEDVLATNSIVLVAAAIGMSDETGGEVVIASVQPRTGSHRDLNELRDRCAVELSRYKRPRSIHVLEVRPKNAVGKIDKNALRACALQGNAQVPASGVATGE